VSQDGRVRIARLGGENSRYWHGLTRSMLTVIDPARITLNPPPA
jgi:hypothetical protein